MTLGSLRKPARNGLSRRNPFPSSGSCAGASRETSGMLSRGVWLCVVFSLATGFSAYAQEPAYFVTYGHYLEEPGNLEIAVASTTGVPRGDHGAYWAPWLELEYGIKGWWTTELYLEGVTTRRDGSGFT